jgi:hypothetical protein
LLPFGTTAHRELDRAAGNEEIPLVVLEVRSYGARHVSAVEAQAYYERLEHQAQDAHLSAERFLATSSRQAMEWERSLQGLRDQTRPDPRRPLAAAVQSALHEAFRVEAVRRATDGSHGAVVPFSLVGTIVPKLSLLDVAGHDTERSQVRGALRELEGILLGLDEQLRQLPGISLAATAPIRRALTSIRAAVDTLTEKAEKQVGAAPERSRAGVRRELPKPPRPLPAPPSAPPRPEPSVAPKVLPRVADQERQVPRDLPVSEGLIKRAAAVGLQPVNVPADGDCLPSALIASGLGGTADRAMTPQEMRRLLGTAVDPTLNPQDEGRDASGLIITVRSNLPHEPKYTGPVIEDFALPLVKEEIDFVQALVLKSGAWDGLGGDLAPLFASRAFGRAVHVVDLSPGRKAPGFTEVDHEDAIAAPIVLIRGEGSIGRAGKPSDPDFPGAHFMAARTDPDLLLGVYGMPPLTPAERQLVEEELGADASPQKAATVVAAHRFMAEDGGWGGRALPADGIIRAFAAVDAERRLFQPGRPDQKFSKSEVIAAIRTAQTKANRRNQAVYRAPDADGLAQQASPARDQGVAPIQSAQALPHPPQTHSTTAPHRSRTTAPSYPRVDPGLLSRWQPQFTEAQTAVDALPDAARDALLKTAAAIMHPGYQSPTPDRNTKDEAARAYLRLYDNIKFLVAHQLQRDTISRRPDALDRARWVSEDLRTQFGTQRTSGLPGGAPAADWQNRLNADARFTPNPPAETAGAVVEAPLWRPPSTVGAGVEAGAMSAGPVPEPTAMSPHTMSPRETQEAGKMVIEKTLNRTRKELEIALNNLSKAQANAGKPKAGKCDQAIAEAVAKMLQAQYAAAQSMWQLVNGG